MIGDVIYCRIIFFFTTSMLDFLMLIVLHVLVVTSYHDSTDDLIGGLGCYARGMARTHDGLMMLLTVGRNRVLGLVVQLL